MELSTLKDAFDRASKKQKVSSSKVQEVIDQVGREIESAILKLQSVDSDQKSIFIDLRNKLVEISPMSQLEGSQKDLHIGLSKYARILEKHFNPDISKAYRNVDFDSHTVNQIIATHLYRHGLSDLGDFFMHESKEPSVIANAALKLQFLEMYKILDAMRSRNLEPALNWAATHRDQLLQNGSKLELKLQQLQFVEILQKQDKKQALAYVRGHLAPIASIHKVEIQKLMTCLLWAGRFDQSPYADELLSETHWDKIIEELTQQYCSLLGHSYESPLSVAVAAGFQGLPTLLKMASVVMAAKKQEWQEMKQLPMPLDLGREFQFHSSFVCPVLREQGNKENPPMLMPCGHVLSKQSILKLSKSSSRAFKCPYCPLESFVTQCRELHF
ncbi:protein RMD5-like protein A-like [Iris pallida]|uniref:Protein RMD5-like protein A-like n=1 Tax=Iris pallida TaxID=29817 RepID=A0AAX6DQP8_IRIPA|nr:protein RMD5-like protein A-like [Iris pallida]